MKAGEACAERSVQRVGLLDRILRDRLFARLGGLAGASLTVVDADGSREFGDGGGLRATVRIHDGRSYRGMALGGSIGAGEAWMNRWWDCDDLVALTRILAANRSALEGMDSGLGWVGQIAAGALHRLRRNTRKGSRSNISEHYDLGNDFYALWLDETMTYSAAVFDRPGMGLAEAQIAKYRRICDKLALGPEDHVLEIGTGWGGFAVVAARDYGCRVTTTTISRRQHDFARERIAREGLEARVELRLQDYRDLDGRYDKLVSIEMFEAVGRQYHDLYFRTCDRLLKPGGCMLLQTITSGQRDFNQAQRRVDFIQRYIFPGGCLPTVGSLTAAVARGSELLVHHLEDIGLHYARTLALWRQGFLARLDEVRALGFGDRFIRMWDYYLGTCEGGFRERLVGDVQVVLVKPDCRLEPVLGRLDS